MVLAGGYCVVVVVHEGCMHNSAAQRIKIKTSDGFFRVLPLAFVEPDEKQLGKRPLWQQLRVFAAAPLQISYSPYF